MQIEMLNTTTKDIMLLFEKYNGVNWEIWFNNSFKPFAYTFSDKYYGWLHLRETLNLISDTNVRTLKFNDVEVKFTIKQPETKKKTNWKNIILVSLILISITLLIIKLL